MIEILQFKKHDQMHSLLKKAQKEIDSLIEDKLCDNSITVEFHELQKISQEIGIHVSTIISMAKKSGLEVKDRPFDKKIRGFKTSSNDRWFGPGSCSTHGGSGWTQINGFASHSGYPGSGKDWK